MRADLPVISDLGRSTFDTVLEIIAALLLATVWTMTFLLYDRIPQSVPTHFNFAGEADAWGMRHTILIIPIATTVIYAVLTGVVFLPPRLYNYPVKITPQNARGQYLLARQLLRVMKVLVSAMFTYLLWWIIQIATGVRRELGPGFMIVTVVGIVTTIAVYIVRAFRAR